MAEATYKTDIQVLSASGDQNKADVLVVEEPLEIWIRQQQLQADPVMECVATTMRTPGDDLSLARGWLITSGLLGRGDILQVKHTGSRTLRSLTTNQVVVEVSPTITLDTAYLARVGDIESSCGICGTQRIDQFLTRLPKTIEPFDWRLSLVEMNEILMQLERPDTLYRQTGACHGAVLVDKRFEVLAHKEDAGRHNAVDKVIGSISADSPQPLALGLSGRISMELVQKAAMAGVSLIIARGAPTSLAVSLCQELDISLVGFVRASQANVYHNAGMCLTQTSDASAGGGL